jgi:hypothetical protein
MSDHPSNSSRQDRLAKLVLAADKSYHAHPQEWRKRVSEFQEEAAARRKAQGVENTPQDWLGPDRSLATMFVLLAIAHDEKLPRSPTILHPVTGKPLEAFQSQDPGVREIGRLRIAFMGRQNNPADSLATLESYWNAVEAHLKTLERQHDEKAESVPEPIQVAFAKGAVLPWWRASLAFALLIVLELIAVIAAWLWGQGDNPLQKIGNCWWLLASLLPVVALVSRLILGRKGWSQVKKMWHSWRGEA